MRYMLKIMLIVIISIIAITCDNTSSKADLEEETPLKPEPLSGLYIAVAMYNNGIHYGGWCHDGTFYPLKNSGNGTRITLEDTATDGTNLFIGGACRKSEYDMHIPGFWMDDEWKAFEEGNYGVTAMIAANKDNLYGIIDGPSNNYLFKNNEILYRLSSSFIYRTIAAINDDVYVGGIYDKKPAYYYNGELIYMDLPDNGTEYTGAVNSICTYNDDIYMLGYIMNSEDEYISGYWKNTDWVPVYTDIDTSTASKGKMTVNSDGVFIVLENDAKLGLWHNGEWTEYSQPYTNGNFMIIITSFIIKKDIIIGVNYLNLYDDIQTYRGGYFFNGEWTVPDVDCDGEVCEEVYIAGLVYQ